MWTLVRKDLILDRRQVALNLAMFVVMVPVFMSLMSEAPIQLFAVWTGIVGAMLPLSLVAREDKFRSAVVTCSLPVTRDAVVASRYVGGWLLSLGTAAVLLGLCYAVARTGLARAAGEWSAAPLAAFVTMGLILAGLIPFTIRFGFAGLMGFLVGLQVLGIALFLAAVLVGGHGTLRLAIGALRGAMQGLQESLGSVGYAAFLVAGVVALNVVSFFLSRGIYRRREL